MAKAVVEKQAQGAAIPTSQAIPQTQNQSTSETRSESSTTSGQTTVSKRDQRKNLVKKRQAKLNNAVGISSGVVTKKDSTVQNMLPAKSETSNLREREDTLMKAQAMDRFETVSNEPVTPQAENN